MKVGILLVAAMVSSLAATATAAEEDGRYAIISGTHQVLGQQMDSIVLLDTRTGKSWVLSCPSNSNPQGCSLQWLSVPFAAPKAGLKTEP